MLILAFDVVNQAFVGNYNGGASALPAFRQGKYVIRIYPVKPVTNPIPGTTQFIGFTAAEIATEGYQGIRLGIWKDSTGTLDDSDANVLALTDQSGFVLNSTDPNNPYWQGTFNTYTQQMADYLGPANNAAAYFAANWVKGADLYPIFDQRGATNVVVLSATDAGGGPPIDMTQATPTIVLPCNILNPDNNHLFALREVTDGNLQFVQIA